jgi:hypothetical protein
MSSTPQGRNRAANGVRVPAPSPSPIPPYPGPVVNLQNEVVSTVEQQSQVVAGQNNPIRIVYGRQILGADVAGIVQNGGYLTILCIWCEGEIDAVEDYWINGADPGAYVTATHYTGTTTQGVDPTLRTAIQIAGGPPYTDALPGIAYSVLQVPAGQCAGFPQATALIRGKKVSTTSGGAKTYSDNPAYSIADFIEDTRYGMGRHVDWASVATVAAHAAEMIGSPAETRHKFNLVIDSPQPVENWLAVMRDYAGCWIVPEGTDYRLILDSTGEVGATKNIVDITLDYPARVQATAHGFAEGAIVKVEGLTAGTLEANDVVAVVRYVNADHFDLGGVNSENWTAYTSGGTVTQIGVSLFSFDETNILAGTFTLQKAGNGEAPTVVEVDYTNATTYPWRTDTTDPVFVPGVYDIVPTVPFRRTRVSKPGLLRYSEAVRYATEMLNAAQLGDLSAEFTAFDVAVELQAGDLVDVTHPCGLDSKIVRVVAAEPIQPGRWKLRVVEHNDAKYSDAVIDGPAPGDTPVDSPLHPPTVEDLLVTERVAQNAAGAWVSQLVAQWTDAAPPAGSYPFVLNYRVDIWHGAVLVETATVQRSLDAAVPPTYVSGALPENVLYTVKITTISTLLAESAPAEFTITNSGKSGKPSDVRSIDAYEVGGEVRIVIEPAVDLDLTAHEYRYGSTGGSWATATLLDRVAAPSVRYSTKVIPVGTQRIYVKGLDSVRTPDYPWGQESVNAIYTDVEVTSDGGAFLAGEYHYVSAVLTGLTEYRNGAGERYWVTNDGSSWNSTFTGAMSTYTDPVFTYFEPALASFSTDHYDFGALITGTWTGTITWEQIGGTAAVEYLQLSNIDSGYTTYSPPTSTREARWSRMTVIGTTTTFRVTDLGLTRVVTVGRSESGTVTTSASGAQTVTLNERYAKAISIQITPATGATARFATYDNVVVGDSVTNTFDAYAFDTAGTKVAVSCAWTFTGV